MSEAPVMAGAEPWSSDGGPHGALVLHGFTGSPWSIKPLAEAFGDAGFAVEVPRLPGHGTTMDDIFATGWDDWVGEAEAAYQRLAARVDKVVVGGLSMGGALTCWLGAEHPEIAGLVCVNPAVDPMVGGREALQALLDQGQTVVPGMGNDIAKPGVDEVGYDDFPLAPLLSFLEGCADLQKRLPKITSPVLILTSPQDHTVAPEASDHLAATVAGPVERVTLERSYHVATLDHDGPLINDRSVDFARKVSAS